MKLQAAAKLVGIKNPVRVLDYEMPDMATLGAYNGPDEDGVHTILISTKNIAWKSFVTMVDYPDVEADTIFHEMTHALQMERDHGMELDQFVESTKAYYTGKLGDDWEARFDHIGDDAEMFEVYLAAPWEAEARETAARLAPGRTIEPDEEVEDDDE